MDSARSYAVSIWRPSNLMTQVAYTILKVHFS